MNSVDKWQFSRRVVRQSLSDPAAYYYVILGVCQRSPPFLIRLTWPGDFISGGTSKFARASLSRMQPYMALAKWIEATRISPWSNVIISPFPFHPVNHSSIGDIESGQSTCTARYVNTRLSFVYGTPGLTNNNESTIIDIIGIF